MSDAESDQPEPIRFACPACRAKQSLRATCRRCGCDLRLWLYYFVQQELAQRATGEEAAFPRSGQSRTRLTPAVVDGGDRTTSTGRLDRAGQALLAGNYVSAVSDYLEFRRRLEFRRKESPSRQTDED